MHMCFTFKKWWMYHFDKVLQLSVHMVYTVCTMLTVIYYPTYVVHNLIW